MLEYFSFDFDLDHQFYWEASISSKDYEEIVEDESFEKLLSAIEMENKQVLSRAFRVEKSIDALINLLIEEIYEMEN